VPAVNEHVKQRGIDDLDGLVACFAREVRSEQPAHPARSFQGSDQVRRNWAQILKGVPDLQAILLGCVVQQDEAWTEWRWSGTRGDGTTFEMRGVTVQRILDDRIAAVRFYMEPVDERGPGVADAVRQAVVGR